MLKSLMNSKGGVKIPASTQFPSILNCYGIKLEHQRVEIKEGFARLGYTPFIKLADDRCLFGTDNDFKGFMPKDAKIRYEKEKSKREMKKVERVLIKEDL